MASITSSREKDKVDRVSHTSKQLSGNDKSKRKKNILGLYAPTDHQIYKVPIAGPATADQHPVTMYNKHTVFTHFMLLCKQTHFSKYDFLNTSLKNYTSFSDTQLKLETINPHPTSTVYILNWNSYCLSDDVQSENSPTQLLTCSTKIFPLLEQQYSGKQNNNNKWIQDNNAANG